MFTIEQEKKCGGNVMCADMSGDAVWRAEQETDRDVRGVTEK